MKAVVCKKYGLPNVLEVTEIEEPNPKDDEMLVKIHAATVTPGDVRLRSSDYPPLFWLPARLLFGLFRPKKKILGHELAGTIEAIGKNVRKFKVGDCVFGTTKMLKTGSYPKYICLPQERKSGVVALKPENLNFKGAATLLIGAMTTLFLLEKANFKMGQQVLIYGASGSVGSYAFRLAEQQGATVTGVCSGSNVDIVKSLGAVRAIDYKTEDYSERTEKYDIVLDAVGKTTKANAKKVLNAEGKFVTIKMLTKEKTENLERIKKLAEQGLKPFIDKTFTLNEIVPAHEYVDSGRKKGNVVIEILQQNGYDI